MKWIVASAVFANHKFDISQVSFTTVAGIGLTAFLESEGAVLLFQVLCHIFQLPVVT